MLAFACMRLGKLMASIDALSVPHLANRYAQVLGTSCDVSKGHLSSSFAGVLEFDVFRSVRDVDENRPRSWLHRLSYFPASKSWRPLSTPFELPAECVYAGSSPSGRLSVRITKVKRAAEVVPTFEVWEGSVLKYRTSASVEAVLTAGGGLGGLSWAPDESKIVFVAEKKKPAASSFFKPAKSSDESFQAGYESSHDTPP